MERLTDTNGDLLNGLYNKDFETPILRLTDYENTGLAPEEVRTLISNAEKSVFTIKTEIAEKAKAYDKISAENAKLRELLTSAVKDFESVANNVAYDGFVCGEECAHFSKCDIFKNDDDRIYRCQKFKWKHADEAEEVLKDE